MCLSKAYVDRNGKMELLSEEVASIEIEKGNVLLKEFFGEQKVIRAHSKEIDRQVPRKPRLVGGVEGHN
jgi:predicted RNA-binding protein